MREDLYNYDSLLKGVFNQKARERIKKYISDLNYRISNLELQRTHDQGVILEYEDIINMIRFLNINLSELEDLGLHRYNAKYGSRGKYIPNDFYQYLIEKHIIQPYIHEPKMTRRRK